MAARKIHQLLGLFLLLPFLGWIGTGVVFLIKPGYEGAYEKVSVKTYPLERQFVFNPSDDWQQIRLLRSTLGYHLLVNKAGVWHHLDPMTLDPWSEPSKAIQVSLLQDAVSVNPARYGRVLDYEAGVFQTTTGVELSLDWDSLSIQQKGADTKVIGTLYKIHYLQWFNQPWADLVLGIVALLSLLVLVVYGLILYLRGQRYRHT